MWQKSWEYNAAWYVAAYNIGLKSETVSIPIEGTAVKVLFGASDEDVSISEDILSDSLTPGVLLVCKVTQAPEDGFYKGSIMISRPIAGTITLRCSNNSFGALYNKIGGAMQLLAFFKNGTTAVISEQIVDTAVLKIFQWSENMEPLSPCLVIGG